MEIRLVVLSPGKAHGQSVPVRRSPFMIGRGADCHLRPASPSVSQRHCALFSGPDGLRVLELGGGTLVNGRSVRGEVELRDGDVLGVGPLSFRVALRVDRPAPAAGETASARALEETAEMPAAGAAAPLERQFPSPPRPSHSGGPSRRPAGPAAAAAEILRAYRRQRRQGN